MCLKPQPPQPIPEATAALVRDLFEEASVYQFVGDVLFEQFRDEDFADLYPKDGQPSISPVLLSFVTIFQSSKTSPTARRSMGCAFVSTGSMRCTCRLDYRGFDHTVLSEFRQRLLLHKAEGRIFNAIFAQLKQLGFYKQRGIQRTDSLAIYTHCRLLKRIELCVETMRVVIKELLHRDPAWTRAMLPAEWEERYACRCKSERLSEESARRWRWWSAMMGRGCSTA
jgi:transposase